MGQMVDLYIRTTSVKAWGLKNSKYIYNLI